MTNTSTSPYVRAGLQHGLATAQAAMHLPEVQEMLRKLSAYNLGVFMPHQHDEVTGEFQILPSSVVQVESDLEVSFRSADEVARQTGRFLPVGWFWRSGAVTPVAVCEMVEEDGLAENTTSIKHKMSGR